MRGAAFFLLATLALLLFDNDVSEAPDGAGQSVGLPLLASHLLGSLAVADHKVRCSVQTPPAAAVCTAHCHSGMTSLPPSGWRGPVTALSNVR